MKWEPATVSLSGVTDCYQPVERELRLTRGCLEVMAQFRNPAVVITKNILVTRDIDVFTRLAAFNAVHVVLSITTLPRACGIASIPAWPNGRALGR